jgi:hypothetical protein
MARTASSRSAIPLKNRVTCPHCWNVFPPEKTLWIAQHPDLVGDPRLTSDQPQRFLPTRFTIEGAAIDAKGFACHELACPKCHLSVPRVMFETKSIFLSILGTPSCGKSYFLASLSWQLRKLLPQAFGLAFSDADPISNQILHQYEELQFLNPNQDELVQIQKTEVQGDLYDSVSYGGASGVVQYPRPFIFSLRPLENHPNYPAAAQIARSLCLYDMLAKVFCPAPTEQRAPLRATWRCRKLCFFYSIPRRIRDFARPAKAKLQIPKCECAASDSLGRCLLDKTRYCRKPRRACADMRD